MDNHVLVIDDDDGLLALLTIGLEREGFTVSTAKSGRQGLSAAYRLRPDVILLDIGMPELDGWATCQRLRLVTDTPIIMLTAQSDRASIVKGLSLGADDYVTKPCSFDELKARIRSALRRASPAYDTPRATILTDGNLCIDLAEGTVTRQGQRLDLTPTETRLLMYLARHEGRVVATSRVANECVGPQVHRRNKISWGLRTLCPAEDRGRSLRPVLHHHKAPSWLLPHVAQQARLPGVRHSARQHYRGVLDNIPLPRTFAFPIRLQLPSTASSHSSDSPVVS